MRLSTRASAQRILLMTVVGMMALSPIAGCGDRNVGLGDGGVDPSAIDSGGGDGSAVLPDRGGRVADHGTPDVWAPDTRRDGPVVTDNDSCSRARRVALAGGKLSLSGDTSGAANQFGADISCGTSTSFDGPQRYYLAALAAGKTYRVTLTPQGFDAGLYAFAASAGCNAKAIDSACGGYASDATGSGTVETITLAPIVDQDWVLVVDAYTSTEQGAFTLEV
ncbi:MAG: hypothetical protein KKI08_01610, partial [Armatimonadetes bacterium]|nr:hypothetical protein [Armatimonadota bacterium]